MPDPLPAIFISYSRQDQGYVKSLINAFDKRGLSVWLDDRIDYGSAWQQVIEKHLRACQVFVLVMTPRSFTSHWVQCELSYALEMKKPIFPLLLEGERWFSVSAIQVVDVKNGAIPPDRFFQAFITGAQRSKPVDARYADLERYLKNGQWEEADNETYRLMITEVGKETGQWFDPDDLLNFPCDPLRVIDGLWVEHSGGKFGFSVQKKIYLSKECGGIPDGRYHKKAWDKFCHTVGWKEEGRYVEVIFDTASPRGHLPHGALTHALGGALVLSFVGELVGSGWVLWILFSRIQTCDL
jgi:hypothetical protein